MLRFRNFSKENSIVATYDVTTTTSATRVYGNGFPYAQIWKMYVDGVQLTKASSTYKFSTTGPHTVKLVFKPYLYSCASLFHGCTTLTNVDMTNFNTKHCGNMYGMFYDCKSLVSLNLSHFYTPNVKNIYNMFIRCYALEYLNIENMDTKNVTNMENVFNGCSKLTSLDLTSFDTSNVTNMTSMFYNCGSLVSLKMMGNVNKVTTYSTIFMSINPNGTFYYNAAYDYSKLIAQLPTTWEAIAVAV